jgi:uncharacterized integral membrane protein
MRKLRMWGAVALAGIAVIVIFQNTQPVVTRFLFATVTMPNAAQIAVIFLIGYAAGAMSALGVSFRTRGRR